LKKKDSQNLFLNRQARSVIPFVYGGGKTSRIGLKIGLAAVPAQLQQKVKARKGRLEWASK